MLSKIIRTSEKIGRLGKSQKDKQRLITTTEVASIWDILSARYDSVETTRVMLEFAKDLNLNKLLKAVMIIC